MSKVKGKIVISYEWQLVSDSNAEIKRNHADALHESAEEQIREAFSKGGEIEGLLKDNIYMDSKDPEDGVDYIGKWNAKYS